MIQLLYGPNTYLIKQIVNAKVADFVKKHGEHGLERRDSAEVAPESLGELLQGASLFSTERLVVLNDAAGNKPVWDALADWTERVPDEVQLLLVSESPDKRTKTFKALDKQRLTKQFTPLARPELIKWLTDESKGKLSRDLAAMLVDRVGEDQWLLWSELNKLMLHDAISKVLIEDLIEPTPQFTVFELLDAVMAKNPKRAQEVLLNLQAGEEPYMLFGLLANQVYILAMLVAGKGKTPQEVATDAGAHPFVVRKLSGVASRTTWPEVKTIIQHLVKLDEQLKSTGADPWLLLETSLMKIATR